MTTSKGSKRARNPGRQIKVVVVGGGIAGLAAAWQLSKRARWLAEEHAAGRRLDVAAYTIKIEVYEASWRLGGKGASGRDSNGRIHEHGLHVWLGFYENAFAMMRECYDRAKALKMGPHSAHGKVLPHASIDDAFFPEQHIGVASKNRAGKFEAWTGYLPPMEGLPGTGVKAGDNPFTLAAYLARAVALTRALIVSVIAEPKGEARPGDARPGREQGIDESIELNLDPNPLRSPSGTVERVTTALRNAVLVASAVLLQSATMFEVWLREFDHGQQWNSKVLAFLEAFATAVRRRLAEIVSVDEHVRRKTEIIDLVITVSVGLYRDRVLFSKQGLDSINGSDCRRWLLDHGATKTSVKSPFITGLYDLAFCYKDGDRSKPSLAAGQALRGALRMFFTYRGSLFWRMRSGMGDSVFSPLYRVLQKDGVKFHFKHRLTRIDFNDDLADGNADNRVVGLVFQRPEAEFAPNALDAAGCWPHTDPVPAEAKRKKLEVSDFDAVIFAMGIDDFCAACDGVAAADRPAKTLFTELPRWRDMRQAVKTVATRSAQAWMDISAGRLGWTRQPIIISGLDPPFETWADMTTTLAAEAAWRAKHGVKDASRDRSVHYFCGVLPERQIIEAIKKVDPAKSLATLTEEDLDAVQKKLDCDLRREVESMIKDKMPAFWPPADVSAEGGPWAHLVVPLFVQANFAGSQRFTLSLPGTLEKRISPLDMSVANMSIAGDWTACGFDEACVEAAVMSGMLAAHAITGFPDFPDIVGYDHP